MESTTLKLKEPVNHPSSDTPISELVIRKPKAKDLRKLSDKPGVGDILDLSARLCSQPPSVIDELCMEDTNALLEIVGNFMEPGQKTGKED